MGDNRSDPPKAPFTPHDVQFAPRAIAGYGARCTSIDVGADRVHLWGVDDLERYVDRDALLRADDPPEPPYWAHCWSGARVLAQRVPARAGRVLEVGCGLGLPGVTAVRRGARVVFADRVAAPLAFVRETLRANDVDADGLVVADMLDAPWRGAFDLVLAAEVLYDRAVFRALASALAAAIVPGGRILLADGHRIDTAAFYEEAAAIGLTLGREDVRVQEDGFPAVVSVVTLRRS
jgi:predicted nicotinamide N-methyase